MSAPIRFAASTAALTACLAIGTTSAIAQEAVIQRFGDWTITIQPAGVSSTVIIPPAPSPFRFAAQTESVPAPPSAPENPAEDSGKTDAAAAGANGADSAQNDALALVSRYAEVYHAIPFSRAEFNANPSYRHDATMEFLFGEMRQTVVYRNGGSSGAPRGYGGYGGYPAMYGGYGFNSFFYPFWYGSGMPGYEYNYPIRPYILW
jgi:hypothetical protein